MSIKQNKALVHRNFEGDPSNPDICDDIFAPVVHWHALNHTTGSPDFHSDPQSEKAAYVWLKKVWGDFRMVVDETIAESDRVMVRWIFHGIQVDEFQGLPPTHTPVPYSGFNIFRIANGRIAKVWDLFDRLWLWQQLGVLPETSEFISKKANKHQTT